MNSVMTGYSVWHMHSVRLPRWNVVSQLGCISCAASLSFIVSFSDEWCCGISAVSNTYSTHVLCWSSHSVCMSLHLIFNSDRWFTRIRFSALFILDSLWTFILRQAYLYITVSHYSILLLCNYKKDLERNEHIVQKYLSWVSYKLNTGVLERKSDKEQFNWFHSRMNWHHQVISLLIIAFEEKW